ncbi:hypothetical protein [Nostoc sp.]|uniref:hypothetical protein n=1 Tax=Nostoc sp. TaxID=1180 RepID=UPI003593E0A5
MSEHCNGVSPAQINYSFDKKPQTKFITKQTPITVETSEVEKIDPNPVGQCWRFTGQGVNNNAYYEVFAWGESPSFKYNGSGHEPYIDGRNVEGAGYHYRSGTQSVSPSATDAPRSGFISSGSCAIPPLKKCKLTVKYNGSTIFEKIGKCPLDYEVICGDDCPKGSRKCTHPKYPGYCCVPCKETGDRLKNIANKAGR